MVVVVIGVVEDVVAVGVVGVKRESGREEGRRRGKEEETTARERSRGGVAAGRKIGCSCYLLGLG
jgi:hypothetical protein